MKSEPITTTRAEAYHVPVLLEESLSQLITDPNGVYIDATFGGGGHSRAILDRIGEGGQLFAFDQDQDAWRQAKTIEDKRFTFIQSNFRYIAHFMDYYDVPSVNGILADLGVSSHHLDDEDRGFSFRFESLLDMRMNQRARGTALDVIRKTTVEELTQIFRDYGEVRGAYRLASLLKGAIDQECLETTQDFLQAISSLVPSHDKKSLAKIFQALRISVNDEIEALHDLLEAGTLLLRSEGRFSIISYHSLEDRPVKNYFKVGNISGVRQTDTFGNFISEIKPLYGKPTLPTESEVIRNPRARSAKLRTAVKI